MSALSYLRSPERPQFGDLLHECHGRTPVKRRLLLAIAFFLAVLTLVIVSRRCTAAACQFFAGEFPNDKLMQVRMTLLAVAPVMLVVVLISWYVLRAIGTHQKHTRVAVYQGGIHVAYVVQYVISTGTWIFFYSGVREVSRSFKHLDRMRVRELGSARRRRLEARLHFSDGASLTLSSADGPRAAQAIETLVSSVGNRAKIKLKSARP